MKKIRRRKRVKRTLFFLIVLVCIICLISGYFLIFFTIPKSIDLDVGNNLQKKYQVKLIIFDINLKNISNDVDIHKLGTYNAKYSYKYLIFKVKKDINVNVVDKEPPIFTQFDDKVEVFIDNEYNEKEYDIQVKDNYDDAENIIVKYKGDIDTGKTGEYYLVYTATDTSGNKTEKVRKVTVNRKSPLSLSVADFNLTDYFSDIILKETGDMGNDYMNQLYFAGDSVFWNFTKFGVYDSSKVWAKPCTDPSNIYTQKVEVNNVQSSYTIPELIANNKPKYVVLNIGGCQSQYSSVEDFIEPYKKFLKDMQENQKNTKIIIQTFNPVIEKADTPYINNAGRNKFNYYIAKMCRELDVPLIDISNILKDETGSCKDNLCMYDGYHPNINGMNMIIKYVRTHGYKE